MPAAPVATAVVEVEAPGVVLVLLPAPLPVPLPVPPVVVPVLPPVAAPPPPVEVWALAARALYSVRERVLFAVVLESVSQCLSYFTESLKLLTHFSLITMTMPFWQ